MYRKNWKFVCYKIEALFLYVRAYFEMYSTDFSTVFFINGLVEFMKGFNV